MATDSRDPMAYRPVELSKPCWTCHWYAGMAGDVDIAYCQNPACSRARSMASRGCSAWMRETGADDEVHEPRWHPEPPAETARLWAERQRLEKIQEAAHKGKFLRDPKVRVAGRSGQLEPT